MTGYRNRITALEYVASKELTPHPGNWRNHGKAQTESLLGILREVGIAGALLAYRSERNGGKLTVIDGHLRKDAAPQQWPVLVLDVNDVEADYLLATHDPLAAMATADAAALDALLSSVNSGEAAVQEMLAELAKEAGLYVAEDEQYSRKIESPVYEPSNAKPAISELFDDAKAQALIRNIQAAEGLTEEERQFLIVAARRHTVLHYNKIADFYAHADAKIQALMEDSALVIIDFDRAIELGYVRLAEGIAKLYGQDYGND